MASTMVLTFGLSLVPGTALAVSSNIVAETKGQDTLTISQIQDLAVVYNDTAKKLQTTMKQLDLQERTTRNSQRDIQNSLNSSGGGGDSSSIAAMKQALDDLYAALNAKPDDAALQAQIAALEMQYQSAVASQSAAYASASSGFESAVENIKKLDNSLDSLGYKKDDLDKSMKDLETQMRYTAASLSLSTIQLEKSIALLEDQISLADKSVEIAELQGKLGMNISTDIEKQHTSKKEAEKSLEDMREQLTTVKRQINILIGRNAGNPLEVVPMSLPVAIDPAPSYTEDLVKKFTDVNYKLKTLERDKQELKDTIDVESDSDEREDVDYQVETKNQDIKDQTQAVSDNLKALLAKINSDGEAYQVSRQKYVTEKKNFEYTQKKYDLGMISELEMRSAELSLKQAEMTNVQNGYQYYLDWQKYYAAEKGVEI